VIGGQSRLEATRRLGLPKIRRIRVEHLDEKEQRLLRLGVSRLGEKGRWNLNQLTLEFKELVFDGVPIKIFAFVIDEIDQFMPGEPSPSWHCPRLRPILRSSD
jgi:hypothetical protein